MNNMNIIHKFKELSSLKPTPISLVKSNKGVYLWLGNGGMGEVILSELSDDHLNEINVLDKYNHITLENEPTLVPIYLDNGTVVTCKVYKVRSIDL